MKEERETWGSEYQEAGQLVPPFQISEKRNLGATFFSAWSNKCGQRLLKEEIEKHGAAANIGKTNRPLTIHTHTHTHTRTRNL